MATQEEESNPIDDPAELAAGEDLSSLARLLCYAKREAEALGQVGAASLVDAALLSLVVTHPAEFTNSSDAAPSGEGSVGDAVADRPARAQN
jgi:hypothetical protein